MDATKRRTPRSQRQCRPDEAGQAPRGVCGGHERGGTDDPIRELRFGAFRAEVSRREKVAGRRCAYPCPRTTRCRCIGPPRPSQLVGTQGSAEKQPHQLRTRLMIHRHGRDKPGHDDRGATVAPLEALVPQRCRLKTVAHWPKSDTAMLHLILRCRWQNHCRSPRRSEEQPTHANVPSNAGMSPGLVRGAAAEAGRGRRAPKSRRPPRPVVSATRSAARRS